MHVYVYVCLKWGIYVCVDSTLNKNHMDLCQKVLNSWAPDKDI